MQFRTGHPCYYGGVRHTVIALISGMALGAILALAAVILSGGWWSYRIAYSQSEAESAINDGGWHIAPDQPHPLHLRRPRFHLP